MRDIWCESCGWSGLFSELLENDACPECEAPVVHDFDDLDS